MVEPELKKPGEWRLADAEERLRYLGLDPAALDRAFVVWLVSELNHPTLHLDWRRAVFMDVRRAHRAFLAGRETA